MSGPTERSMPPLRTTIVCAAAANARGKAASVRVFHSNAPKSGLTMRVATIKVAKRTYTATVHPYRRTARPALMPAGPDTFAATLVAIRLLPAPAAQRQLQREGRAPLAARLVRPPRRPA